MPAADADLQASKNSLPFPPITKQHILNCSFHSWYPKYRPHTPKVRLIPLSPAFVDYLRADGIVLPPDPADNQKTTDDSDDETSIFSSAAQVSTHQDEADISDSEDEAEVDPSLLWPEVHATILSTLKEMHPSPVAPKLNWSAPKDATWISADNSMRCRAPNDIYLLLKSSNFITHDLEHCFDGCVEEPVGGERLTTKHVPFHLALRKWVSINPSCEFRCFVRNRNLLAICQRDLNRYDFLESLEDRLKQVIVAFFNDKMKTTFEDENWVFDVYIPAPHNKVWLIDVNPWAVRTDPILFSWMELLEMEEPFDNSDEDTEEEVVRIPIRPANGAESLHATPTIPNHQSEDDNDNDNDSDASLIDEFIPRGPEFRLIRHGDPEAYNMNSPQYSAHKLPRDVVDASNAAQEGEVGPQRELLEQWQEVLERMRVEDEKMEREDKDGESGERKVND